MATAPPGMVAVAMGNHGRFDGQPRIDIDIGLGTINAPLGKFQHEEGFGLKVSVTLAISIPAIFNHSGNTGIKLGPLQGLRKPASAHCSNGETFKKHSG